MLRARDICQPPRHRADAIAGKTSRRWRGALKICFPPRPRQRVDVRRPSDQAREDGPEGQGVRVVVRPVARLCWYLCGNQPVCRVHDNSSLSHFSTMTRPSWLSRAVRNRHRHAVEQASRRWRGGHDFHTGRHAQSEVQKDDRVRQMSQCR